MEKRKLGKSGLEFAPIAFGGNVFGWTADEATSHKLLDAFVDAGFSFIDTADVYSRWVPGHTGGESEAIIGSCLKKNPAERDKGQVATKCGMVPAEGALKRDHIKWSVDESLKRMNTDRIDLFQSHKDDKATPLEETLSTYGELVKAGKLRFIGASNYDAPRLVEAATISTEKVPPRYESPHPHY
ncbi:MAG: aldo/keto reductase, partial [Rhodospirillaceae bacterium]